MITKEQLNNINPDDYANQTVQSIRDNISLLKLHLSECEKKHDFANAERTIKKIAQLKENEQKKLMQELKRNQKIKKDKLEDSIDNQKQKMIEEKAQLEYQFKQKINKMIDEFEEHQKNDRKNYQLSFNTVYNKKNHIPPKEMKAIQAEIQKCIKVKDYKRAAKLTENLELWKESLEDSESSKKKEEIANAMNHINELQKEELDEFEKKIEKYKKDFYRQHNIKYYQLEMILDQRFNKLQLNQQIERQNFPKMMKEEKTGIILSPKMNEVISEYFKERGAKQIDNKDKHE